MDLDNEELEKTKSVKQAYNTIYTEMCRYMELYNQAEEEIEKLKKDYEQTINELYEEKERYRKLYFEEKERKYNITIPLENTGLEDIEYYYKKGDKWYAHYKETQVDKTKVKELEEQAKSKVTEKELKDMILGMLE